MRRVPFVAAWFPLVATLWTAGCIVDAERGPDLGACAEVPDGVYSWGDVGIGSCIAGPTDVRFVTQDGTTYLAVSNADPYRSFRTGSVLLVDYDAVRLDVPKNYLHELPTYALAIDDDDDDAGPVSYTHLTLPTICSV